MEKKLDKNIIDKLLNEINFFDLLKDKEIKKLDQEIELIIENWKILKINSGYGNFRFKKFELLEDKYIEMKNNNNKNVDLWIELKNNIIDFILNNKFCEVC